MTNDEVMLLLQGNIRKIELVFQSMKKEDEYERYRNGEQYKTLFQHQTDMKEFLVEKGFINQKGQSTISQSAKNAPIIPSDINFLEKQSISSQKICKQITTADRWRKFGLASCMFFVAGPAVVFAWMWAVISPPLKPTQCMNEICKGYQEAKKKISEDISIQTTLDYKEQMHNKNGDVKKDEDEEKNDVNQTNINPSNSALK